MSSSSASSELFVGWLSSHVHDLDSYMLEPYQVDAASLSHADLSRYLYGPLVGFTSNAGKRVRPLICLLSCEAVGGDARRARSSAAAIENFQTAALIHDDIADEGQYRRGELCMHLTQGIGLATNCGDLALTEVFGLVAGDELLDATTRVQALGELFAMTSRTVEGQALDLGWVRDERWDVTPDDYLTMATLKTAHYSAATPLALGAIVGGAPEKTVEALRAFGLDAGLAFQIQDDLLNLVGDATSQGKDYRSDITEGKRTLIAVSALARATGAERDELVELLTSRSCETWQLDRAVDIMECTGAIESARAKARDLTERAKTHLEDIELDEGAREVLLSMADFFVSRSS